MNTKNELNKSFDILKNSANQKCQDIENFISKLENIINSEKLTIEEKTNLILNHDYGMEIWAERQKFVREWLKNLFEFTDVIDNDYQFILEYKNWRFLFDKTKTIQIYYFGNIFYIVRTPEEIEEQYKKRYDYENDKAAVDYYDKKISLDDFLKIRYENQGNSLTRYRRWRTYKKHNKEYTDKKYFKENLNITIGHIRLKKEECQKAQMDFQLSLNDLYEALSKIKEILPNYTYDIYHNGPIKERIEKSLKEKGLI